MAKHKKNNNWLYAGIGFLLVAFLITLTLSPTNNLPLLSYVKAGINDFSIEVGDISEQAAVGIANQVIVAAVAINAITGLAMIIKSRF